MFSLSKLAQRRAQAGGSLICQLLAYARGTVSVSLYLLKNWNLSAACLRARYRIGFSFSLLKNGKIERLTNLRFSQPLKATYWSSKFSSPANAVAFFASSRLAYGAVEVVSQVYRYYNARSFDRAGGELRDQSFTAGLISTALAYLADHEIVCLEETLKN